jgi:uncharacterized membrane protein YgaE (UPF0421/DUF939 family)
LGCGQCDKDGFYGKNAFAIAMVLMLMVPVCLSFSLAEQKSLTNKLMVGMSTHAIYGKHASVIGVLTLMLPVCCSAS